MRPVNLLPARVRPARASGERPGVGYAALGVLAVLLVMVLAYVLTNNSINDAKDETAKATAERQAAEARLGALTPYGEFAQLRTSRESAVRSLATARFDWERMMREVALLLPRRTFLTNLSATPGGDAAAAAAAGTPTTTASGPTVTLAGCSPSHQAVADTVVRLRRMHNVVDVTLNTSSKQGSEGTAATGAACPVSWDGKVTLAPESSQAGPEQVPARLGGGQ